MTQMPTRKTRPRARETLAQPATIVDQYGPFPDVAAVHGVTYDGARIWFATGLTLKSLDPSTGELVHSFAIESDAGTAFDGRHLYQIAGDRIQKVDPESGKVLRTIPAPGKGRDAGLTWAEGTLWVGQYRDRAIHQIDPETGAVLRTIESNRFVTGVTWIDGELWHGTLENEQSELRRVDPESGAVLERLELPTGVVVTGLEADDRGAFYCGGGSSGKLRVVRKPDR